MPVQPSLEQRVEIETPEQVAFSYTVAGVGSRAAAALVDGGICVAALFAVYLLIRLAVVAGGGDMPDIRRTPWLISVMLLAQFAIFWGYYVLWEGLRDGQTPGKRRFGLRVVRDGGFAVDFGASAARNLVRVIDMQPGIFYGVGIASVALSAAGKRLGDLAAGTIVVREQAVPRMSDEETPAADTRPLATLLDDDEYALLSRFLERRRELSVERANALAEQLAARFRDRAPTLVADARTASAFLQRLGMHERQARARGTAARSDTGARREQHALIARGTPRWRAFAARLADAQRRGLEAFSEEEVSDFVAHYRELTTDLARLRTATRGRELEEVYYLSRLVAGGHNLLYRTRSADWHAPWRFLLRDVPAELRRSWRPIALAALLFFGPAVASYVAVRQSPAVERRLVPRGMVDRAETGVLRDEAGGGYLPAESAAMRGSPLATMVTTNNVQISFVAFAGGITAGLLTINILVLNGVMLAAVMAFYARMGLLAQILNFVAAHGVLELTAICIAGGAGFQLAAGILLPGALARRDAIVMRARRAIRLVAAAALLLVVAGVLEGFISPLVWPLAWKLAISATTGVALVWYWTLGMSRQTAPRPLSSR